MERWWILTGVLVIANPQMGLAQQQNEIVEETAEPSIRPNHLVPIVDIVAFDFLLNRYGYRFLDRPTYDVTGAPIKKSVHSAWVVDNDPFDINQFMHPYQGAMYHMVRAIGGPQLLGGVGFHVCRQP